MDAREEQDRRIRFRSLSRKCQTIPGKVGDLLDFGRVRPSVSYTAGAGIVLMRHLLIDVRYNGQFRGKRDVVLPDGSRLDNLRSYNVALSVGYIF